MDLFLLILIASGTALATGLGAIPVFIFGQRVDRLTPLMLGAAIGLMTVASIFGLIIPSLEQGSVGTALIGTACGCLFLFVSRALIERHQKRTEQSGGQAMRSSLLVFLVLFVHSLPEGFAVGTAYASEQAGLSLFVILAITLQNIPEGTSVAIPMQLAGFSRSRQFWAAVGTSLPQPVGAVVAYLMVQQIEVLLPGSLAFAGGAMLALVVVELIPQVANRSKWQLASVGIVAGSAVMLLFDLLLGV